MALGCVVGLVLLALCATGVAQRTVMELYGSGSTLCTLEMTQVIAAAAAELHARYRNHMFQ